MFASVEPKMRQLITIQFKLAYLMTLSISVEKVIPIDLFADATDFEVYFYLLPMCWLSF